MPTARASTSRNSSAPRRRRWTNPINVLDMSAVRPGSIGVRGLLAGGEVLHRPLGVLEGVGVDPLADAASDEVGQAVYVDVGGLVRRRERDARQRCVDAAVDDDLAVLLAHEVL